MKNLYVILFFFLFKLEAVYATAQINSYIERIQTAEMEQYKDAVKYYNKTLELQKIVKDSATICNTLHNLGSCYELLDKMTLAKIYYQDAYTIAEKINNSEIESLSLIKLGIIDANAEWIEQSIDIVERSEHIQVLAEGYKLLSELKADNGDYAAAYENAKKAHELSDSLFVAESTKQLNDFSVKYKKHKAEAETKIYKIRLYFTITISVFGIFCYYLLSIYLRVSQIKD